jgi:hypothetical protein
MQDRVPGLCAAAAAQRPRHRVDSAGVRALGAARERVYTGRQPAPAVTGIGTGIGGEEA